MKHVSILAFYMIHVVVTTEPAVKNCPINCKCNLQTVNCSSANISDISFQNIHNKVEFLDLSKNDLQAIPEALGVYADLIALNLSSNKISSISRYTFSRMWKLKVLDLSNNKIKSLASIEANSLFTANTKLQTLNLSRNQLSDLGSGDDDILYSDSLQILDVSGCFLQSIQGPIVLQGLSKLKYLDLSHNPIVRLEGLASNSLLSLSISYCNLQFLLPDSFEYLTMLKELRINNNDYLIDQYSKPSSKTVSLLDASYGSLDTNYGSEFTEARTILLKGNRIKMLLKHAFRNNTKLEYLDLSENLIKFVDEFTFYGTEYLKYVDLSGNLISILGENTFVFSPYMLYLNLSRNSFKTLSKFDSSSLTVLDISNCKIENIMSDSFMHLPLLQTFNVSYNFLETLPKNLTASKLKLMDLSYCRIATVNYLNFHKLVSLQEINLIGNRLVYMKNNTFSYNNKLSRILLSDNPWKCDCLDKDFHALWKYLTTMENETSLKCMYPENLTGKSWKEACLANWNNNEEKSGDIIILGLLLIIFTVFGIIACSAILSAHKSKQCSSEQGSDQQNERTDENVHVQLITSENENTIRESIRQFTQLPSYDGTLLASSPKPPPSYEEALLSPNQPSTSSLEIRTSSNSLSEASSAEKIKKRQSSTQTDETMNILLQEIDSQNKENYPNGIRGIIIRRPSLQEIEYINIQMPPQCTEL